MPESCHPLLAPFVPLVAMLGEALGPEYEIILHDLTQEGTKIIASTNERLSGRSKDAPLTEFGRFLMTSPEVDGLDYIANYPAEAQNGRQMRSSVLLIRGEARKLVGLLCINYDTTKAKLLLDAASFLTTVRPLSFEGRAGRALRSARGRGGLRRRGAPPHGLPARVPRERRAPRVHKIPRRARLLQAQGLDRLSRERDGEEPLHALR